MGANVRALSYLFVLLLAIAVGIVLLVRRRAGGPGEDREPPDPDSAPTGPFVAFVLLGECSDAVPAEGVLRSALRAYRVEGARVEVAEDGPLLTLTLAAGAEVLARRMGAPVPGREIEDAAALGPSARSEPEALTGHVDHWIVASVGAMPGTALDALRTFTRVVAAITEASQGIGVYWGAGGVAHTGEHFRAIVGADDVPVAAWVGVRLVADGDERIRLLGHGMAQLGLPDLVLGCPRARADEALPWFYDLLALVAQRGAPPPEGDSVGRTAEDRVPVHYAPSPSDPRTRVWCVDLP